VVQREWTLEIISDRNELAEFGGGLGNAIRIFANTQSEPANFEGAGLWVIRKHGQNVLIELSRQARIAQHAIQGGVAFPLEALNRDLAGKLVAVKLFLLPERGIAQR